MGWGWVGQGRMGDRGGGGGLIAAESEHEAEGHSAEDAEPC